MTVTVLDGGLHEDEDYDLDPVCVRARWETEDRHFWYRSRSKWILRALEHHGVRPPASVLEVGCGSGAVSAALSRAGYAVTGVDTAEVLVRKADERCPGARFVVGDATRLPEPFAGPYDALGVFDVLEHLDAPESLLAGCLPFLAPGARVIATVPAFNHLFSVHDALAGHKRRYEPGELAALFRQVGLVDVVEHGIFRASLGLFALRQRLHGGDVASDPAARQAQRLRALRVPPAPVNLALRAVCRLERELFGWSEAKPGASLLVVGRLAM